MKLALMLATDDVKYADRAGCWGTCHHDLRSMPHTPDAETAGGSPVAQQLDLSQGLTKYIEESRSKIEVKGRRGKKRGGWDKLKSADELQAEMDAHKYMELWSATSPARVRPRMATSLEQRNMSRGGCGGR